MKHPFTGLIVPLAVLLPIIVALVYRRWWDKPAKIIFVYSILNALVSLAVRLTAMRQINNLPLFHLFTVVEFITISYYYKEVLEIKDGSKKLLALQISFLVLCVVNAIFFQKINTFNSYTLSLNSLLLMLFAVNHFAKLLTENTDKKLTDRPSFWVNTGLFLYFSGSFIYYIFSNYLLYVSKKSFYIIINLHAGFVLIMYILLAISFIRWKK